MKRLLVICLFILTVNPVVMAVVYFNDGGTHIVDYNAGSLIIIDEDAPTAGTKVEFTDGAYVGALLAFNSANVNITGGQMSPDLRLWDNSTATMSGGIVGALASRNSTQFTLTGGFVDTLNLSGSNRTILRGGSVETIDGRGSAEVIFDGCSMSRTLLGSAYFKASILSGYIGMGINIHDYSFVEISGGTIDGYISVGTANNRYSKSSLVVLNGSDFTINGINVEPGKYATDYVMPDYTGKLSGTITGTLLNGDLFDSDFYVYEHSDILFAVPEPATLLLLGLGGLVLRRKYGR